MILFLFSLFTIANCFPQFSSFRSIYNNQKNILTNDDFSAEITNTGVIINDINIRYEALRETRNNIRKLYFDNLIKGSEYSINYIKANIKEDYFNFDMNYEITTNYTVFLNCMKKVSKYEDNKLYVSMNINNWDFEHQDNDLVFEFSIDTPSNLPVMIINNSTILISGKSDYKIDFNKFSIVDGLDNPVYLSKSNNKYKLYLPYFEKHLYYDFVISYNN
jgi:hypothetical protein